MKIILVIYAIVCLLYFMLHARNVLRFKRTCTECAAQVLTSRPYAILLIMTATCYIAIMMDTFVELFSNVSNLGSSPIPFAIMAFPVASMTYSIFLREGLFAYNDQYLIGYDFLVPISGVKLDPSSNQKSEIRKATLTFMDEPSMKNKTVTMRLKEEYLTILENKVSQIKNSAS